MDRPLATHCFESHPQLIGRKTKSMIAAVTSGPTRAESNPDLLQELHLDDICWSFEKNLPTHQPYFFGMKWKRSKGLPTIWGVLGLLF